jgi:hypothetical protein
VSLVPSEFLRALTEVRAPHRVRRFSRKVLNPELDRIHLHQVGQFFHHYFGDERSLRVTWCTHRPLQAGVDEHVLVGSSPIRDLIDVGQRESCRGAGAASAPRFGVERGDHPIGGDSDFDARCR